MHLGQQQQHITRQVRQGPIALLILAPTPLDFPAQDSDPLGVPGTFGMINGQRFSLFFIAGHLLFQLVDLTARAGLFAIKTTGVQEKRAAHLLVMLIKGDGSEEGMDAPVGPQGSLHALPCRQLGFLHFDNKIQHRNALPIRFAFFAYGRGQQGARFETINHDGGQGNERVGLAPLPDTVLIWPFVPPSSPA